MNGLAKKKQPETAEIPQIVEFSYYEVQTENGKVKANFKDIMDAVEHAGNLVLAGDCKRAKVRAIISIEAVEQ